MNRTITHGCRSLLLKRTSRYVLMAVLIVGISGCASSKKSEKGLVIGAGAGAVIGGVIGHAAGNTAVGAILGAAIGGVAGAYIGDYMDRQAAEMERDLEGAKVERVGEGIKITFASGIVFDVNSASLKPDAQTSLAELAKILNKYEDTDILIEGHTDSTGSNDYNMDLSLRRAQSVSGYLKGADVAPGRFTVKGYGEEQPVQSNDTAEGRQANRRVEVAIFANEKLKEAARAETEG